jgi:lysophospholipase L1-like esterase
MTKHPSRRFALLGSLIFFLVSSLSGAVRAEDTYPLREAMECHPRSGLPNVREKIEAGKSLKIAYLGGSITAAPGWRVQSLEWFQKEYPGAKFSEIAAAIGGTGSDLGVFRLHNDVLRHQPDLLFVEFAVNDGGASPEQIRKSMEGIVRQTWKAAPNIDICFVYTLSEPVLPQLRSGKMQRSASVMEEIADHYGIPSIHFGVNVIAMEAAGELIFTAPKPENLASAKPLVFSTDGVHPHVETGHVLYTQAIARSWPAMVAASTGEQTHALKEPLQADNWELACQIPITAAMLRGDWVQLPPDHTLAKRYQSNMPQLFQAKSAGAALEFTFEGTTAAVFDLLGPDGGQLTVELDDQKPVTRNRIDAYCTYHRMSKLALATELPSGIHKVRITLTAEPIDKREILFERNRGDFDANPKKYADLTWYAGSLLVIGKLHQDAP